MSHKLLFDASFHSLLITLDQDMAQKIQQTGCSCGGKLHQAPYPRSPLGMPAQFRSHYEQRLSFCCSQCHRRFTPPSVRFFGRRWFPAPVLILISSLMQGINQRRLEQVQRHFGVRVSESTWKRWRRWWRETFITTPFWQQAKGLIRPVLPTHQALPRALLSIFQAASFREKMPLLLRFLSPLTGGILRAI